MKLARTEMKKTKRTPAFRPTPAGTLVVPEQAGGIYCAGGRLHVWRAGQARKAVGHCESGYVQGAVCVECGRSCDDYDATWWVRRATESDLAEARKRLRLRIRVLRERVPE